MNVCLLCSSFLPIMGGREWVEHHLANALAMNGHRVVVMAPRVRRRSVIERKYSLARYGFIGLAKVGLTSPIVSSLVLLTLTRVCRDYKIDVINAHSVSAPGTWAYWFTRFWKVPVVGTPHGADIQKLPEIGYGERLNPRVEAVIRRNVRHCTRLTAISPSIRASILELQPDGRKIVDVPNGVWWAEFQKETDRQAVRLAYGIPRDAVVVISVGRNHPKKGFSYGVEVLARLQQMDCRVQYVIVGRDTSPLHDMARSLGVADCLTLTGELDQEEVIKLLRSSDIYMSPSLIESFGLTTLEAMSAGLPCVVTDVPGNCDLVSSEFGYLLPAGDAQGLAEAILQLTQDPSLRSAMGIKAREVAREYDWLRIAQKYEEVYREAVDEFWNHHR